MKYFFIILCSIISISASAEEGKKLEFTREQRESMASSHEKMAECLRSERSIAECQSEMHANCPMGDACPGMGSWHHGMRHMEQKMKTKAEPERKNSK